MLFVSAPIRAQTWLLDRYLHPDDLPNFKLFMHFKNKRNSYKIFDFYSLYWIQEFAII